ncbi:MAG: hypothetical protein KIS92_00810 [Planctomycetota bacterium]|nr:hypothetical protein [Planctomycetota bacterium]
MPAFGVVETSPKLEVPRVVPVVSSLGDGAAAFDWAEVKVLQDSVDEVLSSALISIRNIAGNDERGPITLKPDSYASSKNLKYFSRVQITMNGETKFIGNLQKRREMGTANAIHLTYKSDLRLLMGIPMRGALVWDPYAQAVRFAPRYLDRVNPRGYRNCCKVSVTGIDGSFYAYTKLAEVGTNGEWLDADQQNPEIGVATDWTPERYISYLRLRALFNPGDGVNPEWVKMDTNKLSWPAPSFAPASRMRMKMPDTPFYGERLFGALIKTLDIGCDYGLHATYAGGKTVISFHMRAPAESGTYVGDTGLVHLPLQRSGAVADVKTVYDFEAEGDASEFATGVVVEGGCIEIELELVWNGNPDSSTLIPAWTDVEEQAFVFIIAGDGTWMQGPERPEDVLAGVSEPTKWLTFDGTGGRPAIRAKTPEALQFARQCLPRPFRAFMIQPTADNTAGGASLKLLMEGVKTRFPNDRYPLLGVSRSIEEEQVQPFFEEDGEKRGRMNWPVRLRLSEDENGGEYHDAPYNNGLRIQADGLLYLDGLTDEQGDPTNLIYTGSFFVDPDDVALKRLKLNAVVLHDHRILAHRDIFWDDAFDANNVAGEVDSSLSDRKNRVGLQFNILSPDGFREQHQVKSVPMGNEAKTRVLLSDQAGIGGHCARRLADKAAIIKRSKWYLPGIRPEFRAGMMLGSIKFQGAAGSYPVNRRLTDVRYEPDVPRTALICG